MKRRQRKGGFESWVELSAELPWWASLVLALATYAAFHALTQVEVKPARGIQDLGSSVGPQFVRIISVFLQYLVPAAFVLGAITSAIKTKRRGRLIDETRVRGNSSALLDLSWQDFERLVGEVFRRRGYTVAENPHAGPDGGVDLTLTKGREKFLVQCKRWKATMVGVDVVRELYGVMAARGATGGFVVSAGQFSSDAQAFAEGRNIELVDSKGLIAQFNPEFAAASAPLSAAPRCPQCSGPMVRRTARQGKTAGQSFWGCASYPRCRGTSD